MLSALDIATHGLLSGNSYSIATMGFLVIIEETILPPDDTTTRIPIPSGGGLGWTKQKKKIKLMIFINGKWYEKNVIVNNINLKVKDVQVKLNQNHKKPIIKISFTK